MMYFLFSFWGLVFWPTIFVFTFGMYRHWFCIYMVFMIYIYGLHLWFCVYVYVYGYVFMAMCMDRMGICMDCMDIGS